MGQKSILQKIEEGAEQLKRTEKDIRIRAKELWSAVRKGEWDKVLAYKDHLVEVKNKVHNFLKELLQTLVFDKGPKVLPEQVLRKCSEVADHAAQLLHDLRQKLWALAEVCPLSMLEIRFLRIS